MLTLVDIAHDVAVKQLYGITPCKDDFEKAIIASYTNKYPECGVVNCYDLEEGNAIPISTTICTGTSVQMNQVNCNPIYVRKL